MWYGSVTCMFKVVLLILLPHTEPESYTKAIENLVFLLHCAIEKEVMEVTLKPNFPTIISPEIPGPIYSTNSNMKD